jgi:hypothetical protein
MAQYVREGCTESLELGEGDIPQCGGREGTLSSITSRNLYYNKTHIWAQCAKTQKEKQK